MAHRGLSLSLLWVAAFAGGTPLLLRVIYGNSKSVSLNFAAPPLSAGPGRAGALGATGASNATVGRVAHAASATPAAAAVGAAAITLLGFLSARRRTSISSPLTRKSWHDYERKWWSIKEDRDPTTLPVWQRDAAYGHKVLRATMIENAKRGKKTFWEVRVIESMDYGCNVEMLNSGLLGFCSKSQEGPTRLEVGETYMMECTAAPYARVHKEPKHSIWPQTRKPYRIGPIFSHWHWLEQQKSIKKAAELEAGTIVEGVVYKIIPKGLLIDLDGDNGAKGMLALIDISRKSTKIKYVERMFPPGTRMRCYVIHADKSNGRITLGTKEFEDDEHMGWMLSFPERMMARAEEGVRRYHEKREAYIRLLQR